MSDQPDQTNPPVGSVAAGTGDSSPEYTQEQYEAYIRYQQQQQVQGAQQPGYQQPGYQQPGYQQPGYQTPPPNPTSVTGGTTDKAAKDTASAVFGEVKSAVAGASKREPYALLALASAVFAAVWLVFPESKRVGAQDLKLWTVFVLGCVALLFAPIVRKIFKLDAMRAWQFCVGGAAGLGFAWVAFLLPKISTNHAFFGTLSAAAAGLAAWTAPGRPQ